MERNGRSRELTGEERNELRETFRAVSKVLNNMRKNYFLRVSFSFHFY